MPEPLTLNTIERLARALAAQLSQLFGTRSTGAVTVTADAGADKVLPPNTYLLPVVGGQLRSDLAFKTTRDPATVESNGTGGSWTVTGGGTASVGITSNVGGARHNLAAGTVFRFDPPIADFEPTATLDATMTDGSDAGRLVKSLAFFEDLDAANPNKDIFAAMLGNYPAVMLAWQDSEPAEGLTAGMRQGSTRVRRQGRIMRESFALYVVVGRLASDAKRRQDGLVILQAATRLVSDRQCNDDGEALSSVGAGVEVNGRQRFARGQKHYIYTTRIRCNQILQPIDARTYATWIASRIRASLPGREAPEPTDDLQVVDVTVSMT